MTKKKVHTYNTTADINKKHWKQFVKLMESLLLHGGSKYNLHGFEEMEATDVISRIFGGEDEYDWLLGTMMKYLLRFKNFHREKDLLKVSTYCYILWIKQGNHLKTEHDTDTKR
jgi:hypothetical protein